MPPYLLPEEPVADLAAHLARGGGRGLQRALELGPGGTVQEIALSRLRGRGGAGFRTGTKWRTILGGEAPRYVVCNAAEGEPGTFKDRTLLRLDPYSVLEGLAIAARTMEANEAVVAMKASFAREHARVLTALEEVTAAGWFGDVAVRLVGGPEEYLFGEEKALLEVIEGHDPLPRTLPPYLHGLFVTEVQVGWTTVEPAGQGRSAGAHPTLVNNVETLATAAHVLADGADWFRAMGTDASPGTICVTVVHGDGRAGVVEVEMGTPLREAVAAAIGREGLDEVGCVLSGVSNPPLGTEALDVRLSYEDLEAAGGGLGSAGFLLWDTTTCTVAIARMVSRFLAVESCGQCPPCKLGTAAITHALDDLLAGTAAPDVLDEVGDVLRRVTDANRCYLPVQEQQVVGGFLTRFPDDVVAHLEGTCTKHHDVPTPKLVGLEDGRAVLDLRQDAKQPDWTYR